MNVTIPLEEILKAIDLIENEWGEDSWRDDLPEMFAIADENRSRMKSLEWK